MIFHVQIIYNYTPGLNTPIIRSNGRSNIVAEGRYPGKRSGLSLVADWSAEGHYANQDGEILGIVADQGAATVALARTLRKLFEPLGTHDRVDDWLLESGLALLIGDHLQPHLVQVRRCGAVRARLPVSRDLNDLPFNVTIVRSCVSHDRDSGSTGRDR